MKNRSIFATYPDEYDAMTSAVTREPKHAREVESLIERFHPARVLDAGCATGLTSRLFAERGVEAVGLDRVGEIVEVARRRYENSGLAVSFHQGRFEKLPKSWNAKFDLIVCLANAIVGVENLTGLNKALRGFHRALEPVGSIVIQLRNFKLVKEGELLPVKATVDGQRTYLRMMRRRGTRIELNAIRIDYSQTPPVFDPFSHEFHALTSPELKAALEKAGFRKVKRFGNLLMTEPFRAISKDLVFAARRPA